MARAPRRGSGRKRASRARSGPELRWRSAQASGVDALAVLQRLRFLE
jgi:hypothetical protein